MNAKPEERFFEDHAANAGVTIPVRRWSGTKGLARRSQSAFRKSTVVNSDCGLQPCLGINETGGEFSKSCMTLRCKVRKHAGRSDAEKVGPR